MNWSQQLYSAFNVEIAASQWKAALPCMYVWMDYSCIPQPTAGPMTKELIPHEISRTGSFFGTFSQSTLTGRTSSHDVAEDVGTTARRVEYAGTGNTANAEVGGGEDTGETKGGAVTDSTSDHRQQSANEAPWLTHVKFWLGKAVTSIPAYIERSSLVLVLVPPCEHVDRPGEVCDYNNWRKRGWCRLELAGAVFSRTVVKMMVVKNAMATPEFMIPADATFLVPGTGTYTCCAR
jgi:hypothetical protein